MWPQEIDAFISGSGFSGCPHGSFCLATIYLPILGLFTGFLAYSHCVTGCAARFAAIDSSYRGGRIIVAILAGPLTAISMFLGLGF